MPISGPVSVTGQSSKQFAPMPVDVYQFEVMDIESKMGTKFQSEELEEKFSFTFVCVERGEFYGRRLWRETNTKFVGGQKPSNLYGVLCGITGKTFSKEECEDPSFINESLLNGLIGKQIRLSVGQKQSQSGKTVNTITSFLPVKEQLPAFDKDEQVASPEPELPEV